MNCSLNTHDFRYSLTKTEAFSLLTTTAVPYALRHRELALIARKHPELAQVQNTHWLGHQILFIAECLPIIGLLVAAIEYLVASYFRTSAPASPPPSSLSEKNLTSLVPAPVSPATPIIESKSYPAALTDESISSPTVATLKAQLNSALDSSNIDPMRPISASSFPATNTNKGSLSPPSPPIHFSNTDALLQAAQNYFNNAEIPAPLTFGKIDVIGMSQKDLIETLLNKYNGLCVGEYHEDSSPKYFLTVHMPLFKSLGVDTLYIEGYDGLQNDLDAYFRGDTVDLPEPIRNRISAFASSSNQYNEMDVLMAAKRAGLRIVNIDSREATLAPKGGLLRAAAMNYQAKLIIDQDRTQHPGGKSIIYAGAAHTDRLAGLPGLGQMFRFPALTLRDRYPAHVCTDANALPYFFIEKEVASNSIFDRRMHDYDFRIFMNKPLKP